MKWSGRYYLHMFRNSSFFLGLGILLAWASFQAALETGVSGASNFSVRGLATIGSSPKSAVPIPKGAPLETIDLFEKEAYAWNFNELRMPSLKTILREEKGLDLEFDEDYAKIKLKGADYSGKCLSDILIDLFQPHGLGFYRQGKTVHVTEMKLKRETLKLEKDGDAPLQSNQVRATVTGRVGDPIDIWVDSSPLMRLRIMVQPFYGETHSEILGITIEGYRDQIQWFYHNLKTHLGQDSIIDVKAGGHMWCLITPMELNKEEITLKLEFHYETILDSA